MRIVHVVLSLEIGGQERLIPNLLRVLAASIARTSLAYEALYAQGA